jgi:hypothetical protein
MKATNENTYTKPLYFIVSLGSSISLKAYNSSSSLWAASLRSCPALLSSTEAVNTIASLRITTPLLLDIESSAEAARARLIIIGELSSNLIAISFLITFFFLVIFSFLTALRGIKVIDSLGLGYLNI